MNRGRGRGNSRGRGGNSNRGGRGGRGGKNSFEERRGSNTRSPKPNKPTVEGIDSAWAEKDLLKRMEKQKRKAEKMSRKIKKAEQKGQNMSRLGLSTTTQDILRTALANMRLETYGEEGEEAGVEPFGGRPVMAPSGKKDKRRGEITLVNNSKGKQRREQSDEEDEEVYFEENLQKMGHQLMEMGYTQYQIEFALSCGSSSVDQAISWIEENMDGDEPSEALLEKLLEQGLISEDDLSSTESEDSEESESEQDSDQEGQEGQEEEGESESEGEEGVEEEGELDTELSEYAQHNANVLQSFISADLEPSDEDDESSAEGSSIDSSEGEEEGEGETSTKQQIIPEENEEECEISDELLQQLRADERLALSAILEDSFDLINNSILSVKFEVDGVPGLNVLEVAIPRESKYPYQIPNFSFQNISLEEGQVSLVTSRLGLHLLTLVKGSPMVYSAVEWLKENIAVTLGFRPRGQQDQQTPPAPASSTSTTTTTPSKQQRARPPPPDTAEIQRTSQKLLSEFKSKRSQKYLDMQVVRERLPSWGMREEIGKAIRNHSVVIIAGETGCGKTTQVPQFVLDEWISQGRGGECNVICTQPRRIAAISVAQRVAEERDERVGGQVGYQIRLEHRSSRDTRLMFCTTGILLRRLESDPELVGVSHVIVDEIHERNLESDFLLVILRDLISRRPDLRAVLMSATLNAQLFSDYFGGAPIITIPGFTYPVEVLYLETLIDKLNYTIDEKSPFADPHKRKKAEAAERARKQLALMDRKNSERQSGGGGGESSSSSTSQQLSPQQRKDNAKKGKKGSAQKAAKKGGGYIIDSEDEDLPKAQLFNGGEEEESEWNEHGLRMAVECDPVKILREKFPDLKDSTIRTLAMMDDAKINYELVELLIQTVHRLYSAVDGAILVFLPGIAEITTLYEVLTGNAASSSMFRVHPVHSSISTEKQQEAFQHAPSGMRKVVISTNICETSLTIDDVVFVVDCGKVKESRFDASSKICSLVECWVSKASAQQRKGRAGRVRNGVCYRMYTSITHEDEMHAHQVPEMLRVPLENLCLTVKALKLGDPVKFLAKCVQPPKAKSVRGAMEDLEEIGAIDDSGELTPLGYHLFALGCDVKIGKMILYGAMFRCLDPILTIAACLSEKSPFVVPFEKREKADRAHRMFAQGECSDHLAWAEAYYGWLDAKAITKSREFCYKNYLSGNTMLLLGNAKKKYAELLEDIGFLNPPNPEVNDIHKAWRGKGRSSGGSSGGSVTSEGHLYEFGGPFFNAHSQNTQVVKAVMCAGMYPNIVKILRLGGGKRGGRTPPPAAASKPGSAHLLTRSESSIKIHPCSVNFNQSFAAGGEIDFLVYHEKVKTTQLYVRDCSAIPTYALLLFGRKVTFMDRKKMIQVDGEFLSFRANAATGHMMKELKLHLDTLLRKKIENSDMHLSESAAGIVNAIVQIITHE